MICFHKYNPEIKDGYQFCIKCGKAAPVKCNHKWETITTRNKGYDVGGEHKVIQIVYHQQCKECGSLQCRTY